MKTLIHSTPIPLSEGYGLRVRDKQLYVLILIINNSSKEVIFD